MTNIKEKQTENFNNVFTLLKEKAEVIENRKINKTENDFKVLFDLKNINKFVSNKFIKKILINNETGKNEIIIYKPVVDNYLKSKYNFDFNELKNKLVSETGLKGLMAFNGYYSQKVKQHKDDILKYISE